METKVNIHTDYITLGQLAKLLKLIQSGGEEKVFVVSHRISVNGEAENRRGRKIRPGDTVNIDGSDYVICASKA